MSNKNKVAPAGTQNEVSETVTSPAAEVVSQPAAPVVRTDEIARITASVQKQIAEGKYKGNIDNMLVVAVAEICPASAFRKDAVTGIMTAVAKNDKGEEETIYSFSPSAGKVGEYEGVVKINGKSAPIKNWVAKRLEKYCTKGKVGKSSSKGGNILSAAFELPAPTATIAA